MGDTLSIADISFVCDFAQFLREGHYVEDLEQLSLPLISENGPGEFPRTYEHLLSLASTDTFSDVMGSYLNWFRKKLANAE